MPAPQSDLARVVHKHRQAILFSLVGVGLIVYFELEQLQSGIATMDRSAIRGSAWFWSWVHGVNPKIILGIIHNESEGDPSVRPKAPLGGYVGDNGDSLGPGNIMFPTWVAAGNGTNEDDWRARAQPGREFEGVHDVVRTYKWIKDTGHGVLGPVDDSTALALYNGGPNHYTESKPQTYAQKALGFAQGLV
jgi:hypothetical protein